MGLANTSLDFANSYSDTLVNVTYFIGRILLNKNNKIIVTGALGFIGSHTCKALKEAGYHVIGIDRSIDNVPRGTRYLDTFIKDDFASIAASLAIDTNARAIIHIAGTSLVGPSFSNPGEYYSNNVAKTNTMMEQLRMGGWSGTVVFSSSAAVYGNDYSTLLTEELTKNPISPYGKSKAMCEEVIKDHCTAHGIKGIALRYFNACGCDPQGTLGNPKYDTHLIPRIIESIIAKQKFVLNGSDFDTADGTCLRDYLHVTDIAEAHVKSIELADKLDHRLFQVYNLGTGIGYSNLEVVNACEKLIGQLKYSYSSRRPGDPDKLIADPTKFKLETNWSHKYSDLETIIKTTYNWMKNLDYSEE